MTKRRRRGSGAGAHVAARLWPWVRDVLVRTKALLMFRNELVAVDGPAGEVHPAEPGFTRPRPDLPVVEPGRGEEGWSRP